MIRRIRFESLEQTRLLIREMMSESTDPIVIEPLDAYNAGKIRERVYEYAKTRWGGKYSCQLTGESLKRILTIVHAEQKRPGINT